MTGESSFLIISYLVLVILVVELLGWVVISAVHLNSEWISGYLPDHQQRLVKCGLDIVAFFGLTYLLEFLMTGWLSRQLILTNVNVSVAAGTAHFSGQLAHTDLVAMAAEIVLLLLLVAVMMVINALLLDRAVATKQTQQIG